MVCAPMVCRPFYAGLQRVREGRQYSRQLCVSVVALMGGGKICVYALTHTHMHTHTHTHIHTALHLHVRLQSHRINNQEPQGAH